MFDVNVLGVYRVTQAFAPLIIESKGRISTIGSISGVLSSRFFSQYSMSKHAVEHMRAKGYIKEGSAYEEDLRAFMNTPEDRGVYKTPDEVADAAMHAMFSDQPKRRYMTVPNEGEARRTIGKMIQELIELNEWQAYSYSRDELVEMLDEAMGD